MGGPRHRLRLLLLAAVAVFVGGLGAGSYAVGALDRLELNFVDLRFEFRGDKPPPSNVVVVAIDDVTFGELGVQWPFPRSLHGRAIDRLRAARAKVIAYDVQFTEATTDREDNALYEAVARARNVVLATTEIGRDGSTNILGGDENLAAAHALAGSANYRPDSDGVLRRFPYQDHGLKHLSVQAVERARGRPVPRSLFPGGRAWIDYRGPGKSVQTFSFSRLVRGKLPAGALRGKIVVVGATAPSLQDIHATPLDPAMAGPEIQANAVSTITTGFPLTDAPGALDIALILLMALVGPVAGTLASTRVALTAPVISFLIALAVVLVGAQALFNAGQIVSMATPLAALLLSSGGSIAVNYFTEYRERRRTGNAFRRFVPANVVDLVLEQTENDWRLGGVEMTGTVLFSDVRGFTTFSESRPAHEVIEILNRYLTEMSTAILDHGGTLVSYMGDGIMAVFGAPIAQPDHADRALAAAREMLGPRLDNFNDWVRGEGIAEGFKMGVGLNTGTFMSGNVGSEQRLEYTAIGDTVNTAARLEGMTKGSGHSLFIADSTRDARQRDDLELEFVDELEVRGRAAKIRLWTLAGSRDG